MSTSTPKCPRCGKFLGEKRVRPGSLSPWICLRCFEKEMKAKGDALRAGLRGLK